MKTSKGMEDWEKRWMQWCFDNGNIKGIDAQEAISFIKSLLKVERENCNKALDFLEEAFMKSYCEHNKRNKDTCDDCGRMK